MAIDRRITGAEEPALEMESVDIQTPDMDIEAVEMQEDGSAIINPQDEIPELSFDSNLILSIIVCYDTHNKIIPDKQSTKL